MNQVPIGNMTLRPGQPLDSLFSGVITETKQRKCVQNLKGFFPEIQRFHNTCLLYSIIFKHLVTVQISSRSVLQECAFWWTRMNIIEEKRTNIDSHNNTLPDTIEYVAVWKDTDVNVWNQNIVESSFFFVTKECIRHPHFFGVCHCEVLYLFYKV